MGFKHTGLFPEQAFNWNLIREKIRNSNHKCKVLNLFAYTGAASIAALKEGAEVIHVDFFLDVGPNIRLDCFQVIVLFHL